MQKLIKDGAICTNEWTRIPADADPATVPDSGKIIVPLPVWQEHKAALLERSDAVGLCLEPGEEPELIEQDLPELELIAIHFPAFKDGRGYSYARELRERFQFKGEIRAVGDVLRDQIFYMHRVGFNAFEPREDRDIEVALTALQDFSVTYQADTHNPMPIYRRR